LQLAAQDSRRIGVKPPPGTTAAGCGRGRATPALQDRRWGGAPRSRGSRHRDAWPGGRASWKKPWMLANQAQKVVVGLRRFAGQFFEHFGFRIGRSGTRPTFSSQEELMWLSSRRALVDEFLDHAALLIEAYLLDRRRLQRIGAREAGAAVLQTQFCVVRRRRTLGRRTAPDQSVSLRPHSIKSSSFARFASSSSWM